MVQVESKIEEIESQLSTGHKLAYLEDVFRSYREEVFSEIHDIPFSQGSASHFKKVLFEERIGSEYLKICLVYFTGKAWTGPHTHSEYLVEEILTGSLKEQKYDLARGAYVPAGSEIRETGEYRAIYSPDGFPHNIIAHGGPSLVLNLSYGVAEVEPIEVQGE
jgi:hypothetical protein